MPKDIFDILIHELPVQDVVSGFWHHLASDDRCHLKESCSKGCALAEMLTTSVSHHFSGEDTAVSYSYESAFAAGAEDETYATEAWQQSLPQRCRHLARLPRLTCLHIRADSLPSCTSSDAGLVAALVQLGSASEGRLTSLSLEAPVFSSLAGSAIALVAPGLREVTLGWHGKSYVWRVPLTHLQPGVFAPFRTLTRLKKLVVCNYLTPSTAALHSIGGLTRLRHLDLFMWGAVSPAALQPLTSLTCLEFCRLFLGRATDDPVAHNTLASVAPLLTLTRLEHLHLPGLVHAIVGSGATTTAAAADTAAAASAAPALAEALVLLGGLVNLQSLLLGSSGGSPSFVVDDGALDAIRRLARLTHLGVSHLSCSSPPPPAPAAGHLPMLRRLDLDSHHAPHWLLHSLLPLAPLSALRQVGPHNVMALLCNASAAAWDAASLPHLVALLARSPHFQPLIVDLLPGSPTAQALSLPIVAESLLRPLAGRVGELLLCSAGVSEGDWAAVAASLPRLPRLRLGINGPGGAGVLASVVAHLTALTCLEVVCMGGSIGDEGWVALAAVAASPLRIVARNLLPCAELVAQCRAEGERVHGRCNISFETGTVGN